MTRVRHQQAVGFASRFDLVGLYLRVRRMDFYSWGNRKLPKGGPNDTQNDSAYYFNGSSWKWIPDC